MGWKNRNQEKDDSRSAKAERAEAASEAARNSMAESHGRGKAFDKHQLAARDQATSARDLRER